ICGNNGKVGIIQDQDVCLHFHMNITEDQNFSGFVESETACFSLAITAQVKLSRQCGRRKHVMQNIVAVGKFNDRTTHDWQHSRRKRQVPLIYGHMGWSEAMQPMSAKVFPSRIELGIYGMAGTTRLVVDSGKNRNSKRRPRPQRAHNSPQKQEITKRT